MHKSLFLGLTSLPVAFLLTVSSALGAPADIRSVGYLSASETFATAINNSGMVTGVTSPGSSGPEYAFRYTSPGPLVNLGTLSALNAWPNSINSSGTIVGVAYSSVPSYQSRAFRITGSQAEDLGTLGGTHAGANAVNDAGTIVGWAENPAGAWRPFRVVGGSMKDLGTPGYQGEATAINNHGVIVGWSTGADSQLHVFRLSPGTSTSLPSADQIEDLGDFGFAAPLPHAINDAGVIVGETAASWSTTQAFRFSDGAVSIMGNIGSPRASALAINSSGYAVGEGDDANGLTRAVLWKPDGTAIDLDQCLHQTNPSAAGWILRSAKGINDAGQIVGQGWYYGGALEEQGIRGFVLDASVLVPEPASSAVISFAVSLLLLRRPGMA